jgi:hypothetical protein
MLPFSEDQVAAIRANLSHPDRPPRDLAIWETWLHILLRVSDFRELTVADVQTETGAIRDRIVMRQRKVSTVRRCQPVEVDLPPRARGPGTHDRRRRQASGALPIHGQG